MAGSAPPVAAQEQPVAQGCNVSYWKERANLESWRATGYSPSDRFRAVFRRDTFGNMTLRQVLRQDGGSKVRALGRDVVAGLLNAASPGIWYALRTVNEERTVPVEVKTFFRWALRDGRTSNWLYHFRTANGAGCPLIQSVQRPDSLHRRPSGPQPGATFGRSRVASR